MALTAKFYEFLPKCSLCKVWCEEPFHERYADYRERITDRERERSAKFNYFDHAWLEGSESIGNPIAICETRPVLLVGNGTRNSLLFNFKPRCMKCERIRIQEGNTYRWECARDDGPYTEFSHAMMGVRSILCTTKIDNSKEALSSGTLIKA